jgi:hypothetical protein
MGVERTKFWNSSVFEGGEKIEVWDEPKLENLIGYCLIQSPFQLWKQMTRQAIGLNIHYPRQMNRRQVDPVFYAPLEQAPG